MAIEKYFVPESSANICFDCQNACGGCSWSIDFTPVPGWTAEKKMIKAGSKRDGVRWIETFRITACPEFVKDEPRHRVWLAARSAKNRCGGLSSIGSEGESCNGRRKALLLAETVR